MRTISSAFGDTRATGANIRGHPLLRPRGARSGPRPCPALSWRPISSVRAMTPPEDAVPHHDESLLGTVVAGNFRIDRLIGSGAMGNVYQGQQLSLGKAVAVKVLHRHLMADEKLVRRFQARSQERLSAEPSELDPDHRLGPGRQAARCTSPWSCWTGRDLAQVIREEFPLPVPRIVRIMSQVLSALDEAHAQRGHSP